ncbi:F-box protein At2g17036-like [Chenopodium quinoa]|uniref:F-box protein At2g17036-like n=1 Tax=Chenopodium quinoa TaxID=63459 RepID=UPI000B7985DA|nr:F-box protein At2g17036-like [Chenopodium quinoa]
MANQPQIVKDWSSLPVDILSLVLRGLNKTETDRRRLRSVCTSWRASLFPPNPPLHFPLESVFYLISKPAETETSSTSTDVWLTRVDEMSGPFHTWTLQNPISPAHVFLPMPDFKAEFSDDSPRAVTIVMLPKSGATAENYSLLALYVDGNLGLLKSGAEEWVIIPFESHRFSDVIAYKGEFYAIDYKGKLISIDPRTFEVKTIARPHLEEVESEGFMICSYLVESCGKLCLVNKVVNMSARIMEATFYDKVKKKFVIHDYLSEVGEPLEFMVSTLSCSCSSSPNSEKEYYWETVKNLGDRLLFVSEYVSFSLSAREIGWSRGNCIFFTQEGFKGHGYYCYGDAHCDDIDHSYKSELQMFSRFCGLHTLKDGRVMTGVDLPSKFTKIFWPMPTWLASNPILPSDKTEADAVSF